MLADLTILLHEMSDALRGRGAPPRPAPAIAPRTLSPNSAAIVVTGLASPQKGTAGLTPWITQFEGLAVVVRSVRALPAATESCSAFTRKPTRGEWWKGSATTAPRHARPIRLCQSTGSHCHEASRELPRRSSPAARMPHG